MCFCYDTEGYAIDTKSEQWRRECELRWIAEKTLQERRNYLQLVEVNRGIKARLDLEEGLQELWKNKK